MYQMLGVLAEFQREIIRERINAGLSRAKASGKTFGRPRVDGEKERKVRQLLAKRWGINRIAAELSVGSGTVRRIKAKRDRRSHKISDASPGEVPKKVQA